MPKVSEVTISILCLLWFMFITTNVNQTLGLVYSMFIIGGLLLFWFDKKKTIVFDRDGKWTTAFIIAGVSYIVFVFSTSFIISFLEEINVGGLISLLAATTPALATSAILNSITFSIPVAYAETQFWARLADFFASRFNIRTDKKGLFTIMGLALIATLSFIFLMFHVTAKGILNNAALMLVFLMMFVSLGLAFYYRESKHAVLFHIIANSVASIGLFKLAPLLSS